MDVLTTNNIMLNASFNNKWESIKACGQILQQYGYVQASYIEEMIEREKSVSVYIGNNVAIPHGITTNTDSILHSGLSVIQVPEGVDFDGNAVKLLVGIAGKGEDHIALLSKIALILMDEKNVALLVNAETKEEILAILQD